MPASVEQEPNPFNAINIQTDDDDGSYYNSEPEAETHHVGSYSENDTKELDASDF